MIQISLIKEKGTLHLTGFDAAKISKLLADKHSCDVFVPECKNGETWGARDLLKLDAWVLLKTYSPLTTIGYEIKCSRSDFENDQKWVGYLDLCHMFYFVCPAGMIRSIDLPSRVGLIWVSQTGKLHTKRKATRENPDTEKLNRLLIYVLMARSKIVATIPQTPQERIDGLRSSVEIANGKKELAYFVKGHIRDIYDLIGKQQNELRYREGNVKRFEEHLARLGIIWNSQTSDWQNINKVENEIDLLVKHIDWQTLQNIKHMGSLLTNLALIIEKNRNDIQHGVE